MPLSELARTTLVFTIAATESSLLGLGLALLLRQEFSFQGIIRSSLIVPMAIAPVVVGIIWRLLYNADVGLSVTPRRL
jgi:multiple sugar transport system permease protein